MINRRTFLAGVTATAAAAAGLAANAASRATILINADPNCGCCKAWAAYLETEGFAVDLRFTGNIAEVKRELGVPGELASCHTAVVAGYVIEGYVPAPEIKRLLLEKPSDIAGLAVPQMPLGSPGMEVPGAPEQVYDVVAFADGKRSVFATYRGKTRLSA